MTKVGVRGLITKQASCTRGPPPEQMVVHQSSNEDRSKHVHHHGYQGVLPAAPQTKGSHRQDVSKGSTRCKRMHKDAKG